MKKSEMRKNRLVFVFVFFFDGPQNFENREFLRITKKKTVKRVLCLVLCHSLLHPGSRQQWKKHYPS
jgi:hypothetical protein